MFVSDYFSQSDKTFSFSHEQGSNFAKGIAGDFNPLHDPGNKRFCIPGDLLFALALSQFGVSQKMTFDFQGMIGGGAQVFFNVTDAEIVAVNEKDKPYLTVSRSGEVTSNEAFVEALIRSYVAFSGKTFPHILVQAMKEQDVMINCDRPMVIYDRMELDFETFSEESPEVVLDKRWVEVNGKRGMMIMEFDIKAGDSVIGKGRKQIILSGLKPYDQESIDRLIAEYDLSRENYFGR